ncbi:hypothetical protein ACHWQZ_G014931 [Mnemiopsis leidyi]
MNIKIFDTRMKALKVGIFLLQVIIIESTNKRRFNILKFGQSENDYVMFTHDMSQFETGFTVCSWVRKLRNEGIPTWFSYAVSDQPYEIQISDMGDRTRIFGDSTNLVSLYTVTPGTWFHNCLSWDSVTSTRDVYIDGVRVDSKATPAGRILRQGGTIVLGNEQQSGPGAGMDTYNMFWGELYKLNMFTRKLDDTEIRELSVDMCSEVEMKYGNERGLKWEDLLQKTKYGNVVEKDGDFGCMLWYAVHDIKMEYEASIKELNNTILQLTSELNSTMQNDIVKLKNIGKELSRKTQVEKQSLDEEFQESSKRQETIQLITWILAGTSALNTLTIFFFVIQKCLDSRKPSMADHEYAENVVEAPNIPAADTKPSHGDDIVDEEIIYDDMQYNM